VHGRYIEGKEMVKVAIFNEQCLNVDHEVFGDPSPEDEDYSGKKECGD
jgi:hypothetical protein